MISFLLQTGVTVIQIGLAFYGFWFVWRVLLPVLPGPNNPNERIAPYARYFTDPLVIPLARHLRLNEWLVSALFLLTVAAAQVGLARLNMYLSMKF